MLAVSRMRRLEALAASNCDSVNTDAMVAVARGCINLRSVDFSGMDLVSIEAVRAFVSHCSFLHHLTCDNCAFNLTEYKEATKFTVAMGQPQLTRNALEPRPRSILEYNKYVNRVLEMDRYIRVLQRFCRAIAVRTRSHRHHKNNKQAVVEIRNRYATWAAEKGRRKEHLLRILKRRAVVHIQRWFRNRHGVLQNQRKVGQMMRRNRAAALVQRVFRGHMGRKRVRAVFDRLYRFYTKFGYLVWRAELIYAARRVHRHITAAQSAGRMFPIKLNFWLYRRAIRTLQVRFLKYMKRLRAARQAIGRILDKLDGRILAANKIRKNWRIKMFNKKMSGYVFFCCIVWRSRDDEKDWRLLMLQSWYRGSIVRLRKWRREQIPIIANRSVLRVQRLYRGFVARRLFCVLRRRLKRHMVIWRALIAKPCALRIGRYLKPFQRGYKLHFFRAKRDRSALTIMRCFRGSRGRIIYRARRAFFMGIYAAKLQRKYRVYKGRCWRKLQHAIRHMSAWKIQRHIHNLFDIDATRRIKAKTAARHRREHVAYKRQLLVDHWTSSLKNRRDYFMYLYARRIQKCFRSWYLNKFNRLMALETRAKLVEQLEEEVALRKSSRFLSAIPNPFRPAARMANAAYKQLIASSLVSAADEPRLFNAVLKYNTKSIVQVGIINMKLTFGDGELKSFEAAQAFTQAGGKPFYTPVPGDLSGKMRMNMKIWIMRGLGEECITHLKVAGKPLDSSMPQLRSREAAALMRCEKITWHPLIHYELHGRQSVKEGKGGFSITDIKIVNTEDEGDDLKDNGWTLVQDMNSFGMPSYLFIKVREAIDDQDLYRLNKIKTRDWFDSRLLRTVQTFNMSESDILSMRKVYETMLGGSISELQRIVDLCAYWNVENDQMTQWIVQAVKPQRTKEVSFSEYVQIVCYFSMFGPKDLKRFLFGCMDVQANCFLMRDKFVTLVEIMANAGVGNPTIMSRQFDKYKDRKLDSLFFGGFERFTYDFRGIMWKVEDLQKTMRMQNLGVPYWEDKQAQFADVRKTLGVKLI